MNIILELGETVETMKAMLKNMEPSLDKDFERINKDSIVKVIQELKSRGVTS